MAPLVKDADILVENYRPGVIERWGLGYDELVKIKPDIILASASAWGGTTWSTRRSARRSRSTRSVP